MLHEHPVGRGAGPDAAVTEIVTTVTGTMGSNPSRFTAMNLSVSGVYADREMMEKLILIAERGCLVANSIKDGLALSVGLAWRVPVLEINPPPIPPPTAPLRPRCRRRRG